MTNMNYIYNYNDVESLNMLRMRRAPFFALFARLRMGGLLVDSIHTSVEEQVVMFLNVVGHNPRFRIIHNTFRRSMETTSRYFNRVLYAIDEMREEMIKSPTGQTPEKICNSVRWMPYFKDCIDAIDGTHVTARVPRLDFAVYMGRKHYTSQNVVVDFDMMFTYVLASWERSAHDATILADNMSRPDGINIPDGKFYLGDAGYGCRPGILPPFGSTKYHLDEFTRRNRPQNAKKLFNLGTLALRLPLRGHSLLQRIGSKSLNQKPFHTFSTQVKLVLACCILHNWILGYGLDSYVSDEENVILGENDTGHGVKAFDNEAWKQKRMEWATAI